jgi:AraC-like DNA-binding protein
MNFADYLSLLGVLIGFSLGGVVWRAHRAERPTHLLSLFIISIAARAIPALLYRQEELESGFVAAFLPLHFFYLSIPLLYLYVRALAHLLDWRRDWVHLIPGAVEFFFCSSLLLVQLVSDGPLWSADTTWSVLGAYTILSLFPGIVYSYFIIRTLNHCREYLLGYYSNMEDRRLNWTSYALYFNIFLAILYSLLLYGPLDITSNWGVLVGAVGNTALVGYVSYQGLRQLEIDVLPPDDETVERDIGHPAEEVASHSKLFSQLDEYVRDSKAYLNPQLTIADLARHLDRGERTLSRVINTESEDHFNGYINGYRIADAKRLLRDPAYDHYTMEGIALETGFNSKATFYKSFRQHSEVSPAVYRKQSREK